MTERTTIEYWLVVDWEAERVRTRKTKPTGEELDDTEFTVRGTLRIQTDDGEPTVADVRVPESEVHQLVVSPDEEGPEWGATVEAVLANWEEMIADMHAAGVPEDQIVDEVVERVLREAEGLPDPAEVTDYVRERVARE